MLDALVQATRLPNQHPAVVHFPVALLLLAMLTDALFLLRRRWRWLDGTATLLYVAGAVGALAAFLTGKHAAEAVGPLSVPVQRLVNAHADWAERTLWLFAIVALARVVLAFRDRRHDRATALLLRIGVLAAAMAGSAVLVQTADRGGGLVYGHGVAVTRDAAEAESGEADAPSQETRDESSSSRPSRLVQQEGITRWTPKTGGAIPNAIEVLHVGRLVVRRVEDTTVRDRSDRPIPTGRATIGASAVGGHYKGIVGGEPVVHGHRHATREMGRTGLLLEGRGHLRILSLHVSGATEEE